MTPGWVRTYTGKYVSLRDPTEDMVSLTDIAHHLSLENRWTGATVRPYSVAEHSLWVAKAAMFMAKQDYAMVLGMFHDAHEFVLKDQPTPLKALLPDWYRAACDAWDQVIAKKLGFKYPDDHWKQLIHLADAWCAWVESQTLFQFKRPPSGVEPPEPFKQWMASEIRNPRTASSVEDQFKSFAELMIRVAPHPIDKAAQNS